MSTLNDKLFEQEQAELMANLTLQMEKFCQIKEHFFAAKFNLTPVEFRCLRLIKDNVLVSSKMLTEQMNLSPGRVSHLIAALDKKGFVIRKINKNDRRLTSISLTSNADDFIQKVKDEYNNLHEEILKYLPKDKRVEIFNNMKFFFLALKDWATDLKK